VADFCNCVIVMTSNLGADGFQRGPAGFRAEGMATPDAQEHFTEAVRKFLRPEIYNRLDAIVPFRALSREVVLGIAERQIELLRQRDGFRLRPVELLIYLGCRNTWPARVMISATGRVR
jgi:ATP-dependent Clp protease ATP-binding subunit ClpA